MDVMQALKTSEQLIEEIEADFPELVMWGTLREMTQTTGPAVEKLAGDVKQRFVSAAAAADRQSVKLFQMGLAVAGYRANSGDWGTLDYKRAKMAAFDLDSYRKGDLDFDIDMRPLLPDAKGDNYTIESLRWDAFTKAIAAGMPLEMLLRDDGWDEARIAELLADMQGPLATKIDQIKMDKMKQEAALQAQAKPAQPASN